METKWKQKMRGKIENKSFHARGRRPGRPPLERELLHASILVDYIMKDARVLAKLLTAQEAAELLSLKVGTIRDMTYRKEIPYVKIGKRGVRYRLIDLLD